MVFLQICKNKRGLEKEVVVMTDIIGHQKVLKELLLEFNRICEKHNIKYILFSGTAIGAIRHKGFIPWDDDLDVAMLRTEYERFLEVAPKELNSEYYLQAEFSEHWPLYFSKLRKNNTTCLEKYHPKDKKIHQGIYIDIFPIDNASDNKLLRKVQFFSSKVVLAKAFYLRGYDTDSVLKKIFIAMCRFLPLKPFHRITLLKSASESEFVHSFLGGTSDYQKGIYQRKWFDQPIMVVFDGDMFPVSAYYDEMLTTIYGDYMQIPKEEARKCKKHALLVDAECDYSVYENYRDGMSFDVYTRGNR